MLKEDDEDYEEEYDEDYRAANRGTISAVLSFMFSAVSGEFYIRNNNQIYKK